MAHRSNKSTEQPSTPKTPRANSKYPLATPITPPSPVLTISQLERPPWNGGSIPIIFDSDDSDASEADDSIGGGLRASRYSRGTFGSICLPTPTSNSNHSGRPPGSLSFSNPSTDTPQHTPSSEAPGSPEADKCQNEITPRASKMALKPSHTSSSKSFHAPGLSTNASNFTISEYYLRTSSSGDKDEDRNPFVVMPKKEGSGPLKARPTAPEGNRPATAPTFSTHGHTFSIKRKPPPTGNFDMVTEIRGAKARVGVIEPFLEHPFRLAAGIPSHPVHHPTRKPLPVTLPSSAPVLPSSPSNTLASTPVLKPKTNTIISTPKLRPKTADGERRKNPWSEKVGVLPLSPKASQAQRGHHLSGNRVARSNLLPTPNPSAMNHTLPTKPFSSAVEGLVLRIHIDQERFRGVSPAFIYHGFKEAARSSGGGLELKKGNGITDHGVEWWEKGMIEDAAYPVPSAKSTSLGKYARIVGPSDVLVEYKMQRTESFCFHYSPLDSSPTLRRLTVDGDDKHDYFSREAALILKTNGLYSVKSSELKGAAMWKFTYSIDDRRNSAGDKISGEKLLTPLSLVCSPELLNPDHKRSGFLFGVKKSISTKITAVKIDASPMPPDSSSLALPHQSAMFPRRHQASRAPSISVSDIPSEMSFTPLLVPVRTLPPRPLTAPKRPITSRSLPSLPKSLSIPNLFVRKAEKSKTPTRPWTSSEVSSPILPPVATKVKRPTTTDSAKHKAISSPIGSPPPFPATRSPPHSSSPIRHNNASSSPFDRLNPVPINEQPAATLSSDQNRPFKPMVQPIASKEQINHWLTIESTNNSERRSQESLFRSISPVTSRSTSSLTLARPRTSSSTSNQIDIPRAPGTRGRSPLHSLNSSCPLPPRAGTGIRQRPSTANESRRVPPNWVSGLDHCAPRPKTATLPS